MSDFPPESTTKPDRTIGIVDVYNETLALKSEVQDMRKELRDAQRPVSFPRFPLWALVAAVFLHAVLTR